MLRHDRESSNAALRPRETRPSLTCDPLGGRIIRHPAKVTLPQARKVALNAYPGKVVSEELEQESGGSGLRYSFVIQHKKVKHEVGVDANTGAVLENAVEGKNPD